MPVRQNTTETLTPRERAELDWEKEAAIMQKDYGERLAEMELEVKKLEVKWTQVFRIPEAIILLPVKLLMALAITVSVITKKDLPPDYWRFMG